MSTKEAPFQQERVIIESGILAVTLLFAIAGLGQKCEAVSTLVPSLSFISFFFIAAAFLATWRKMMGEWRPIIDEALDFFEVIFFSVGLLFMLVMFYSFSAAAAANPIPAMFVFVGISYAIFLIARWTYRWHKWRMGGVKEPRSKSPPPTGDSVGDGTSGSSH